KHSAPIQEILTTYPRKYSPPTQEAIDTYQRTAKKKKNLQV
ncbi:15347_t:CDS:1, partial [Racocetra persica]